MRKPLCVVVPAYNEARVIEQSLQALSRVIPREDIYVVSDGSRDGTGLLARNYKQSHVVELMRNFGKSSALNFLIRLYGLTERYEYILFSDADSQLSPNFLDEVKKHAAARPACMVGTVASERHGYISAFRVYEYGLSHRVLKRAQNIMKVITVAPGCASLYRSDVIEQLDFSNHTLTEDFDLTLQIHNKKLGEIIYIPKARVITQDPPTLRDYWKQIMRWYTGFWQNMLLHKFYKPNKMVNLELNLLLGDTVFWLVTLVLALFHPLAFLQALLATYIFITLGGVAILMWEKQWWAIKYAPLFFGFQFVNLAAFIISFYRGMRGAKKTLAWDKVNRYWSAPVAQKA